MKKKKEVTIKVHSDTVSDFADVLCWFSGYMEGKGEDWEGYWLKKSLESIRDVKVQIQGQER